MQTQNEEAVTSHDLVSINALVEYLAHQKGFNRENAYYLLETEFGVSGIDHIKRSDLDRAIAFLVDLQDITVH